MRQFITILYELAKNSADHTAGDAFLGIDIFESNGDFDLQFLFGDTGEGIKDNIKNHLESEDQRRERFFSLVEAYYIACQKGFTSKPKTGRNLGVGMSTAIESSQMLGLSLSVFDAASRGVLSNIRGGVHSEIRKIFYPASRNLPFCYFGKTMRRSE
jgi:signal transduction histidine kinase